MGPSLRARDADVHVVVVQDEDLNDSARAL
jgi:hypothetical protein